MLVCVCVVPGLYAMPHWCWCRMAPTGIKRQDRIQGMLRSLCTLRPSTSVYGDTERLTSPATRSLDCLRTRMSAHKTCMHARVTQSMHVWSHTGTVSRQPHACSHVVPGQKCVAACIGCGNFGKADVTVGRYSTVTHQLKSHLASLVWYLCTMHHHCKAQQEQAVPPQRHSLRETQASAGCAPSDAYLARTECGCGQGLQVGVGLQCVNLLALRLQLFYLHV